MSGQIIELIIFAAIAFLVISKFISTLGTTNEDGDDRVNGKFFGEKGKIKDVSPINQPKYSSETIRKFTQAQFAKKQTPNLDHLIVKENKDSILSGIDEITDKIASFNPVNFVKGSKAAFKMILQGKNEDGDTEGLIDKRYFDYFKSIASSYGKYNEDQDNELDAKISETYMFGNNIFIKVLFTGQNITDKMNNLHEEWTFTKSSLNNESTWHLTNIDRTH